MKGWSPSLLGLRWIGLTRWVRPGQLDRGHVWSRLTLAPPPRYGPVPSSTNRAQNIADRRSMLRRLGFLHSDSTASLIRHEAPKRSLPGVIIAALSLCAMPLLARAKRRVAEGIGSAATHTDPRQTDFCTYLSAILLGGLLLNSPAGGRPIRLRVS